MPVQVATNALILIGILPSAKDLDIARMLGWYRIPLKSSPKVIDVDYLAFYQGANFGEEHRWRIEYLAEYRGHELTTRRELLREERDHPRANEEYYKVQIGPLIAINSPILADKWKRITFLYSTGELFNQAQTVNDLVVRSEEREILWKSLRERNQNSSNYKTAPEQDLNFDLSALSQLFEFDLKHSTDDLLDY